MDRVLPRASLARLGGAGKGPVPFGATTCVGFAQGRVPRFLGNVMGGLMHYMICGGALRGERGEAQVGSRQTCSTNRTLLDCSICVSKAGVVVIWEEQTLVVVCWQLCELGTEVFPGVSWVYGSVLHVCVFSCSECVRRDAPMSRANRTHWNPCCLSQLLG